MVLRRISKGLSRIAGQRDKTAWRVKRADLIVCLVGILLPVLFFLQSPAMSTFLGALAIAGLLILTYLLRHALSQIQALQLENANFQIGRSSNEADLNSFFELAPIGMAQVDGRSGLFTRVNQHFCEMLLYGEAELIGTPFQKLLHPDYPSLKWNDFENAVRYNHGEFSVEKQYIKKDGSFFWAQVIGIVLPDANGTDLRCLAVVQDMTVKKEEEQALQQAKELAEAASQMKSTFLANMSHELRTPLGAVVGFADLLMIEALTPDLKRFYAANIRRNGAALARIIDDILDLSKVEVGKIDFENAAMSISEFVIDLNALFTPIANEKGLIFSIECLGSVPLIVHTDRERLRQVLVNLIGNAIKFTSSGEVKVSIGLEASIENKGSQHVSFTICDSGPGISDQHKLRLFQPFSQADISTTRRFGGTGLGLALSKQLIEGLSGRVELVSSVLGQGSTFKVTLPCAASDHLGLIDQILMPVIDTLDPWPIADQILRGKRILLAEDAPDNQILISNMLTFHGCEVCVAANGEEAIQMIDEHVFDIVLMDLQMPQMDGYTATRNLRDKGYNRPIIALTAHALRDDSERSLRVGCNAHLTKPIDFKHLLETIMSFDRLT